MKDFTEFIETLGNRSRENYEERLKDPATIKISLKLLDEMPSARELVFEYFAMVAEISVQSYVKQKQLQQQNRSNNVDKQEQSDQSTGSEEDFFTPVLNALNGILCRQPQSWRPVIASWSIKLVSSLSEKYNPHLAIIATCSYWLKCTAMHGCMSLLNSCLCAMPSVETEVCVKEMLETFHRHPKSFHWVMARLGGCFPKKIITHLLQCGLTRFMQDNRCRLDSEIGILEQLTLAHEEVERDAFREFVQSALTPKKPEDKQILPYLLAITCYSENLLTLFAEVFLEFYNEQLYEKIATEGADWLRYTSFMDAPATLNHFVLRLKRYGVEILLANALSVEKYEWCRGFLEANLRELESRMIKGTTSTILEDLTTHITLKRLWLFCLHPSPIVQQTAVRLLLIVSTHRCLIYYQTIAALLQNNYTENTNAFGAILCLLNGQAGVANFPKITPGFKCLVNELLLREKCKYGKLTTSEKDNESAYNAIVNLTTLRRMQKAGQCSSVTSRCLDSAIFVCLPDIIKLLEISVDELLSTIRKERNALKSKRTKEQLSKGASERQAVESENIDIIKEITEKWSESRTETQRLRLAHELVNFLNLVDLESKINLVPTPHILLLARASVKYFFVVLSEPNIVRRVAAINRICQLLQRQCTYWKTARNTCLRELIEGALYNHSFLFGCVEKSQLDDFEIPMHELVIMQNESSTLGSNSNRAILHSGVIGSGLRLKNTQATDEQHATEKKSLIRALDACCANFKVKNEPGEPKNNEDGYTSVALILVDLISPDVMHNGLEFPDEEHNRVTIERDMLIRRHFTEMPVLWPLLGFLATNRPALCYAAVLLRALLATCIHQWRARNVNRFDAIKPDDELVQFTKKVLQLLAVGQFLPPPLSKVHSIIEHFDSLEITSILRDCVWNYLRDNPALPEKFVEFSNGLRWRDCRFRDVPAVYINPLRHLLQQRMNKLGSHLHQMFVMPTLIEGQHTAPVDMPHAMEIEG